ncbi:MAG: ABC transporter ATP-binding protein [Herbaspirillum sp.]
MNSPSMVAGRPIVLAAQQIELAYRQPNRAPNVVLRDFSLQLAAGEIIAILGPSGVGKSSLLRVLAGLQTPDQGTVSVNGEPLQGPHPHLGFVFQDPSLLPWLTLAENVAFGLDFTHQRQISREQKQLRVQAAIAEVGLQRAIASYPSELSGGMAQRASLARTLARQPEILLLDEPFSALDEITRSEMQALLQGIVSRHRSAAILVTHDIDEALILADRVLLIGLSPGRLIGEWKIDLPHPREEVAPGLLMVRAEIVRVLREARRSVSKAIATESTY